MRNNHQLIAQIESIGIDLSEVELARDNVKWGLSITCESDNGRLTGVFSGSQAAVAELYNRCISHPRVVICRYC